MKRLFSSTIGQAVVIAGCILATIFTYAFFQIRHDTYVKKHPKDTQKVATQATASGDAEQYLLKNMNTIDPQQRLLLDYLHRKFNISDQFDGKVVPITLVSKNKDRQQEFDALQRIAYPDRLVSNLGRSPSLLTMAANCDHIPLPKDFSQQLGTEVNQGGYSLTHVALSIQMAKELGCTVQSTEPLIDQARKGMNTMASDSKAPADLRYESIALLAYSGYKNDIQDEWINKMVSEQQQDGSWSPGAVPGVQIDHTTTLALWALLEYKHKDAPQVPILRH